MSAAKSRKSRSKKVGSRGVAHIRSTFNNTIISLTDSYGQVIAWQSAGSVGYKGARKSTPFAAQLASSRVAETAYKMGLREVDVRVKGPGSGRESAIRGLAQGGLRVLTIEDVTPLPHNGCRPRKKRRV